MKLRYIRIMSTDMNGRENDAKDRQNTVMHV